MHFSACSMTSRRSIWSHHVAIYLRSAASAAFSCLLLALSVGGCDHESPSSPSDDSEAVSDSGDDSSTGAVCVDLTEYEPGVSWFDFGECRVGEVTVAACSAASPLLRPCDASFAEWCGYQGGDIHACDEMELDLDAPYQCDNFSALHPACDRNFVDACDSLDFVYIDRDSTGTRGECGGWESKWCCDDIVAGTDGVACQNKKWGGFGCGKDKFSVNCKGSSTCSPGGTGGVDCTCIY
jgi:hypothetical protein